LREFDVEEGRFTGHIATFSNSLVFVSPAVGLLKFGATLKSAAKSTRSKAGTEPDLEERGSVAGGRGKD